MSRRTGPTSPTSSAIVATISMSSLKRHRTLLAEQETGACVFHVLVDGRLRAEPDVRHLARAGCSPGPSRAVSCRCAIETVERTDPATWCGSPWRSRPKSASDAARRPLADAGSQRAVIQNSGWPPLAAPRCLEAGVVQARRERSTARATCSRERAETALLRAARQRSGDADDCSSPRSASTAA